MLSGTMMLQVSDDSDDDDDDKKITKKGKTLLSITINKKPSIFDNNTSSSWFMNMDPKVQYDE